MSDIFQKVAELRNLSRMHEAPADVRENATVQLTEIEHRREWQHSTSEALVNLCSDVYAAKQVRSAHWERLAKMSVSRAMHQLRAHLVAAKLLSPKDGRTINCQYPQHPTVREYRKEQAERFQAMLDEVGAMLAACSDARKARRIYNGDLNPMSPGKINSWRQKLVRGGILKASWRYRPCEAKKRESTYAKMRKQHLDNKMLSKLEDK